MLRKIACKHYKSMKNLAAFLPFLYMERARQLITQQHNILRKNCAELLYIAYFPIDKHNILWYYTFVIDAMCVP